MEKDLVDLIVAKIVELGLTLLKNESIRDTIEGILPELTEMAVVHGFETVDSLLQSLASDQSADAWRLIIERATPQRRIEIMRLSRQAAEQDVINKIKRDRRSWDLLIGLLKGAAALAPAVLL